MITTILYRGYHLTYDESMTTDIWSGSDYLDTLRGPNGLNNAKALVDEWVDKAK